MHCSMIICYLFLNRCFNFLAIATIQHLLLLLVSYNFLAIIYLLFKLMSTYFNNHWLGNWIGRRFAFGLLPSHKDPKSWNGDIALA
jgi:hypothetical protein